MPVPHLPPHVDGDAVAAALAEHGCAVVDDLVPPTLIDDLLAEMAPYLEAAEPGGDDFTGRQTTRVGALVARSKTARELVRHPLARSAVAASLAHATSHQLHLTQIIALAPGQAHQVVHRDQWAFDFFPFPAGYEVQTNTIWAGTDFTEANGATRVIPGSHRFDDKLRFELEDTEPAEMSKGSVLFYTGALYHGGGPNSSDAVRVGINITYNVSWLRQEENQYLSVPREVAETLDDDLLRLLGYQRGAYALGYIDDLRDPLEAIRGAGSGRSGAFGDAP